MNVKEFMAELYRGVPPEKVTYIFTLPDHVTYPYTIGQMDRMLDKAMAFNESKDVYFGLHLMGYTAIAGALGLPKNTVKSFCRRNGLGKGCDEQTGVQEDVCRQCGEALKQDAHRKTRRFCSDACRLRWWHAHRDHGRNAKRRVCPTCQKEFTTDRRQTYCSHACYILVQPGNVLEFILADGNVISRTWKDHSRRESWTPEKREQARQKMMRYHSERRACANE